MEPALSKKRHYPALDGVRGFAILLVVVYHNFGFIDYLFFGWLGVDLFFVLSGFLITDILLRTAGTRHFLRNFYTRRILRIFPLYYLCLFIFLVLFPLFSVPLDLKYYTDNQVWLWTFLQNWLYIFKNPGETNTLNHLWSLAVEEQFYLIWPLVFLLVRKPAHLLIIISLALLFVIGLRLWIWENKVADLAYFNLYTFTRIDGICIGCMIALIHKVNTHFLKRFTPLIVFFFAIVNLLFYFINRRFEFSFPYLALVGYTTLAMMFGLLVFEAVTQESKLVNWVFNFSLLKFFGRISFSFYIFHWPVYLLMLPWLSKFVSGFTDGRLAQFTISLLATIAAIIISWLSYHYYERYFLTLKERFV